MIIVDNALAKRYVENNPVRVGLVGAGFMGKAIAYQICRYIKGMELVAISNRTIEKARQVFHNAGVKNVREVASFRELELNIRSGQVSIAANPEILCEAAGIDVIIEVTGAVDFGAGVALSAIKNKKHIVMVNAEADGTVGPILKVYADRAGVVYTTAEGDQPGVTMNLYRFVKSLGVKPVLCGNIKGLHDPYRNPTTQESYAQKYGINKYMVTAAADGSKISFEQAIIANATGMCVAKRGMHGPTVPAGTPIKEVMSIYPQNDLLNGNGIVDYVIGAEPAPGVFILGTLEDPFQQHYLNYYKLGDGPLYCFYTPYHLCHLEIPFSAARAALFNDATLTPFGRPFVEVITAAKIDLKAGEILDGIGHYKSYGLAENASTCYGKSLLPIGVAEGCQLKNDIVKDQVLTYDDVIMPEGRLIDRLRKEQNDYFSFSNELKN